MSQLVPLKKRLQKLRFARLGVRWGEAACILLVVVTALLGTWYALDLSLELDRLFRGGMLVSTGMVIGYVFVRFVGSRLGLLESLEQTALVVERDHALDNDLIAALQFEKYAGRHGGSARLSEAVVAYVAEFSHSLNVFKGFDWGRLPRWGGLAGAAVLVAVILIAVAPAHAAIFWQRLWLRQVHYPTQTQIVDIDVNGEKVPPAHTQPTNDLPSVAIPQRSPLVIRIQTGGRIPESVRVKVQGDRTGEVAEWAANLQSDGVYLCERSDLVEPSTLRIFAGDARSDPFRVHVTQRPIIDVAWRIQRPDYARRLTADEGGTGRLLVSVWPGSLVELSVRGRNKALRRCDVVFEGKTIPLTPVGSGRETEWKLTKFPALQPAIAAVRLTILAEDNDGLHVEPAPEAEVRLLTDRPPRIAGGVISRRVLPTATPRITYGATDDVGVKALHWKVEIVHADGTRETDETPLWNRGAQEAPAIVRGEQTLQLDDYELARGDEVRITLLAEDDRGPLPGVTGRSEPIILEVTDREGILNGLLEIDEESARQLDAIIERELGIGRAEP